MIIASTTYNSHFNDEIVISQNEWGVTLICNSRSSGSNTRFIGTNHAEIMIEGVTKTNDVFTHKIHLMGEAEKKEKKPKEPKENDPNKVVFKGLACSCAGMERVGRVLVEDKTGKRLHHSHKSETWLRPSGQVQKMMDEAVIEKDFPMQNHRPFSILGDRSWFTVNLETFEIRDTFVNMLANSDSRKFEKLYKRVETCKNGSYEGIQRLKQQYFYPLKDFYPHMNGYGKGDGGFSLVKTTMDILWFRRIEEPNRPSDVFLKRYEMRGRVRYDVQELFESCTNPEEIDRAIDEYTEFEPVRAMLKQGNRWLTDEINEKNYFILKDFRKWAQKAIAMFPQMKNEIDAWMVDFEEDALSACRNFMMRIYENSALNPPLEADNCFTWARKKLALIDVQLEDVGIESVISATKLYMNHVSKKTHTVEQEPEDVAMVSLLEERNSQPMRRIPNSQSVQEPSFSTNARRVIVDTSTQAARRVCAVVRCERAHSFDEPRGFAAQQDEGCLIL